MNKNLASPSQLRPRRRPKLTDEIVLNLREEIVSGQLPAGTKLPSERDLAKQYEVSQPTIREIMRALDSMGLIEVRHGSGVYVSQSKDYGAALALQNLLQLGGVGIVEVLEVRDALGRASARRAAEMATLEEISDIEEKLAAVSIGSTDSVETLLINIEAFQVAVSAAAHCPLLHSLETFLIKLLLLIQSGPVGARGLQYWRNRSAKFQKDREEIVEAIRNRDPETASLAMARYLSHQRDTFRKDPDLKKLRITDPIALSMTAKVVIGSRK